MKWNVIKFSFLFLKTICKRGKKKEKKKGTSRSSPQPSRPIKKHSRPYVREWFFVLFVYSSMVHGLNSFPHRPVQNVLFSFRARRSRGRGEDGARSISQVVRGTGTSVETLIVAIDGRHLSQPLDANFHLSTVGGGREFYGYSRNTVAVLTPRDTVYTAIPCSFPNARKAFYTGCCFVY